jgi:spermidine synthase
MILIATPAAAMGATLPLAVRWFVGRAEQAGSEAGALYACNTVGAALGAGVTGFVLLPALGLRLTTLVGIVLNVIAAAAALRMSRARAATPPSSPDFAVHASSKLAVALGRRRAAGPQSLESHSRHQRSRARSLGHSRSLVARPWLAAAALGLSGFIALLYEVVWTRILGLVIGPTTYAFTTMLVTFIAGLACGSAAASRIADHTERPALWLGGSLILASLGAFGASFAVGQMPLTIAGLVSAPEATFATVLARQSLLVLGLLLPMTIALGAAFPFAVAIAARRAESIATDVALVYAADTLGAIAGALAGSFLLLPLLGLQRSILFGGTLGICGGTLLAAMSVPQAAARLSIMTVGLALAATGFSLPAWNRELISSGAYKYAPSVTGGDLQAGLEAGTLLFYREGAAGTVSVRRAAGTTSLAIDGKVDASNGGDMLTQKLLAHLPLLLHPSPRNVYVIGLGSGVTVGAALQHPIARVDALEISPEVIAASWFFQKENRAALADGRTKLIVGDGRTHLTLSSETYDVIISEPSNPWMAGIAALFTREFFEAARAHLAPGGILCQWAHTYDIGEEDLRSIVATFASVFPDGAMWLVGEGDLLLIGSTMRTVDLLENVERAWSRPAVAADLSTVGVRHPFEILSLFVAGGPDLARYAGGRIQTDDRLALEFSAPKGIYVASRDRNVEGLRRLAAESVMPPAIARLTASATSSMWRDRGLMQLEANAPQRAYEDLVRAATSDPHDAEALAGLGRAAAAAHRTETAKALLRDLAHRDPHNAPVRIALSRLLASSGEADAAIRAAREVLDTDPSNHAARAQLASILADLGDAPRLAEVVEVMSREDPERPTTLYYLATLHFLRGEFAEAAAVGERAALVEPSNGRTRNLLGGAYANLGRVDRARGAFAASVLADPKDPSPLINLGLLELNASSPSIAAMHFAEALLLDPDSAPALNGLADALDRQGLSERAARVRRILLSRHS